MSNTSTYRIVTKNDLSGHFRIVDDLLEVNIDDETIIFEDGVLKTFSGYMHYIQSSGNSDWLITHNLNRFPQIKVFTNDGIEVNAKITNINNNTSVVQFSKAETGYCIIET